MADWRVVVPGALGPVDQDPDEAREVACDLLSSQAQCEEVQVTVPRTPRQTSGGGGLGVLGWVFLAVAAAVLVWLLVRFLSSRAAPRRPADSDPDTGEELTPLESVRIDRDNEPSDWRERSQAHRRAGEHRHALRCEYRALVGDLARRHLLDEIPGRTTGEERTQLRGTAPMVGDPFGTAADMFDNAWYGGRVATAKDCDRFDELERQVLSLTEAARGRRAQAVPG